MKYLWAAGVDDEFSFELVLLLLYRTRVAKNTVIYIIYFVFIWFIKTEWVREQKGTGSAPGTVQIKSNKVWVKYIELQHGVTK